MVTLIKGVGAHSGQVESMEGLVDEKPLLSISSAFSPNQLHVSCPPNTHHEAHLDTCPVLTHSREWRTSEAKWELLNKAVARMFFNTKENHVIEQNIFL